MDEMIILFGMHRSGTSALAGMLHTAGIKLGESFMQPLPENPKGFFEDLRIQDINKRILASIGRDWNNLPDESELDNVPDSIIQELPVAYHHFESHFQKWAWKDPRLCLTFPLWAKILPLEKLSALFIIRNPMSVARSLFQRNQIPLEKGMELWSGYNLRTVEILRRYRLPYTFIRYESLVSNPFILQKILERRLNTQMGDAWRFIDDNLNRSETGSSNLPEDIKNTYDDIIQDWDNTDSLLKLFDNKDLKAGENSFENGDLDKAREYFEKVLRDYPNHADALNNLGVIEFVKDNLDDAVLFFNRSLDADHNCFDAIINKANCLKIKGDLLGAINEYTKALNADMNNPDILASLIECCRQKLKGLKKTRDTFPNSDIQPQDDTPPPELNLLNKNMPDHEKNDCQSGRVTFMDRIPRIQIISFADIETDAARKLRWGDHWVKLEIQRELEKRGYLITNSNPDIILHLFGVPLKGLPREPYKIIWIHSHPDLITPKILREYDKIYCLSPLFTDKIKKWGFDVEPLIGGTAKSPVKSGINDSIVFVGNTKNVFMGRKIISDLNKTSHMKKLRVWGEGWESILPKENYVGIYYENDLLPGLYASSYMVLNDHHEDMRREGFLNPRILDVFASGGFVISDDIKGLDDIFQDSLITYKDAIELEGLINFYFNNPGERERIIKKGKEIVHKFSFNKMVDTIVKNIEIQNGHAARKQAAGI